MKYQAKIRQTQGDANLFWVDGHGLPWRSLAPVFFSSFLANCVHSLRGLFKPECLKRIALNHYPRGTFIVFLVVCILSRTSTANDTSYTFEIKRNILQNPAFIKLKKLRPQADKQNPVKERKVTIPVVTIAGKEFELPLFDLYQQDVSRLRKITGFGKCLHTEIDSKQRLPSHPAWREDVILGVLQGAEKAWKDNVDPKDFLDSIRRATPSAKLMATIDANTLNDACVYAVLGCLAAKRQNFSLALNYWEEASIGPYEPRDLKPKPRVAHHYVAHHYAEIAPLLYSILAASYLHSDPPQVELALAQLERCTVFWRRQSRKDPSYQPNPRLVKIEPDNLSSEIKLCRSLLYLTRGDQQGQRLLNTEVGLKRKAGIDDLSTMGDEAQVLETIKKRRFYLGTSKIKIEFTENFQFHIFETSQMSRVTRPITGYGTALYLSNAASHKGPTEDFQKSLLKSKPLAEVQGAKHEGWTSFPLRDGVSLINHLSPSSVDTGKSTSSGEGEIEAHYRVAFPIKDNQSPNSFNLTVRWQTSQVAPIHVSVHLPKDYYPIGLRLPETGDGNDSEFPVLYRRNKLNPQQQVIEFVLRPKSIGDTGDKDRWCAGILQLEHISKIFERLGKFTLWACIPFFIAFGLLTLVQEKWTSLPLATCLTGAITVFTGVFLYWLSSSQVGMNFEVPTSSPLLANYFHSLTTLLLGVAVLFIIQVATLTYSILSNLPSHPLRKFLLAWLCFHQCLVLNFTCGHLLHQLTLGQKGYMELAVATLIVSLAFGCALWCLCLSMGAERFVVFGGLIVIANLAIWAMAWKQPPSLAPLPFSGNTSGLLWFIFGYIFVFVTPWFIPLGYLKDCRQRIRYFWMVKPAGAEKTRYESCGIIVQFVHWFLFIIVIPLLFSTIQAYNALIAINTQ